MKKILASVLVMGLVAFVGCNTSNTGGGPKAGGGTFTLKAPPGITTKDIKHGSDETFKVTLDKGKDFKEDVTLTAEVKPGDKGVSATVDPSTIKGGDATEANVKVSAKETAQDGDYTVTVTGKPAKGESTNVDIKVRVPKKS